MTLASLFAACADSPPGNSAAYQEGSQNCSSEFVINYNQVASAGRNSSVSEFESLVNQFENKYRGVSCKATKSTSTSLGGYETYIDVNSEVRGWREAITRARSGSSSSATPAPVSSATRTINPGNPDAYEFASSNCSSTFIEDFKALLGPIAALKDNTPRKEVEDMKKSVADFRKKYQDVQCYIYDRRSFSRNLIQVNAKTDELTKALDKVLADLGSAAASGR